MGRLALSQRVRIAWFRRHWTCAAVSGRPHLLAPAVLAGEGQICFDGDVTLGWRLGPDFLAGYTYIEARYRGSNVRFGNGTHLNNGVTIVSEGPGVTIGARCVIGPAVHIYDSDFHPLDPAKRSTGEPSRAAVTIGDEVFVGTNAMVLKGVTVGSGSVVGAGAIVTADVPSGSIVAGNPARLLT